MFKAFAFGILTIMFLSVFASAASTYNVNGQEITVDEENDRVTLTDSQGNRIDANDEGAEITTPNGTIKADMDGAVIKSNGNEISISVSDLKNKVEIKGFGSTISTDIAALRAGTKTSVSVSLSNGKNAEVKVLPETASIKALQNMQAKCEEGTCTVELKEVGSGNDIKVQYEVKTQKKAKIFGIFGTTMQVSAEVDAETGTVKTHGPWWSFLATKENVNVTATA